MNKLITTSTLVVCVFFGFHANIAAQDFTATLRGTIVDEQGKQAAARVWIETANGRYFKPDEPENNIYEKDRSFSTLGKFSIKLPAGKATVHIEKGKEFLPVRQEISVDANSESKREFEIKRWIDLPAEGYYSADMHVHLGYDNLATLKQLALADDVHLIPAFTYWLTGRGETWMAKWPEGIDTQPIQVDPTHLITRNNIEVERIIRPDAPSGSTVGATFFFNLENPVTADSYGEHFPADAALARDARRHSPNVVFDSDKPSWPETVIGVALNGIDTIQVCHNHYHRDYTLPGRYGMIGPIAVGDSNTPEGDGLFHRTNNLYYRLLNCGFPLGVSGGSAIGVMPVPTGFNRVYARIEGELTAQKMWTAIKAGRTFATTGPMLTMTVNGRSMGDTIELKSQDQDDLRIEAHLRSIEPIEAVQIIHNGLVVSSTDLRKKIPSPFLDLRLDHKLSPDQGGWVAARAIYRNANNSLRQAHTSPIYVKVDGSNYLNAEDLRYMLKWIDQLVHYANSDEKEFATEQDRKALLLIYDEARKEYEKRLNSLAD